ncbi:monovalent cation/H+ antiporter subunit D family protein [Janibacter sp. GXQ6167]|uniref:monovalent cation/H+ antiporter subunit D family protein n=1 Tax=Janibacter sp. GXQ6167 TaxID=3240791 RepID=UPI0035260CED
MTIAPLLPLLVIVPLLAAAVMTLVRNRTLGAIVMVAMPVIVTVVGVLMIGYHRENPVVANALGGFADGIAIPFVSDTFSAVMITVTGLATSATCAFLVITGESRYRFVVPLVLMLIAGVNGALLTGDLFNLFVFVEVMLLPSYALIALTGSWRRLGVGRLFVTVNLVTSTILLMGVGLVYGAAGTVNLAALAGLGAKDPRVGLALTVVLLALAIKAAVVPAHTWLPRTYPATSPGIMALFSALHTKVALYAIYRIYSVTFAGEAPWLPVLIVLVALTIVVGALSTLGERTVRHALSFQMVSGVGHILVGLAVFTAFSLGAGLLYMVHHIVTMGALLLLAGAIEHTYGSGRFDRLSDLIRRDPWVAGVFAIGLLSLVGLPPASGLWGKVALVASAAQATPWIAATMITSIIIASILSLLALQRMWDGVFWGQPMETYRADSPRTRLTEPIPCPPEVRIGAKIAAPGIALMVVSVGIFLAIGAIAPVMQQAGTDLTQIAPYVEAVLPR